MRFPSTSRTSFVAAAAIAALVATTPVQAQEGGQARQRWPGGGDGAGAAQGGQDRGGARAARPRDGDAGQRAGAMMPRQVDRPSVGPDRQTVPVRAQRQAQPRGGRPRGDNPATGRAVPRVGPAPRGGGGRTVVVRPGINRFYYPPYAYGGFGLGLGSWMYDPYWYGGAPWGGGPWAGYGYGGYYGAGMYPGYGYGVVDTGRLRLDVEPREADVYVDGYYAGRVDDFDGRLQGLRLESGGYNVEIVMPGFETLAFDVRITPGRTTTYRGTLVPGTSSTPSQPSQP